MAVSHVFSDTVADWTGTVTVYNSQGSTTTIAATNLIRPQDWNSVHNQFHTLSGNTLLSSTASGTNVIFAASGPSLSLVGSSDSIIWSTPQHVSSMEFPPEGPNVASLTMVNSGNLTSAAVAFNVKQPISASFMRFFANMATGSSLNIATTAASLSASVEVYSTWNAVVYTLGTGASSKSLMSVASGSAGVTQRSSISVAANGTQYSITQQATFPVEGGTTTTSTQYSASTSNYQYSSNYLTPFSASRCIDVPFANSLPAGAYWLLVGISTAFATNSTGVSAASQGGIRLSQIAGASQINVAYGIMGSTNLTSGGIVCAGSFSTAGGGTTAALPISAISSTASHPQIYFQLLRSA